MKVRHGFVSNSSSSNFIIGLNKKKYDIKELMHELYQDQNDNTGAFCDYYNTKEEGTVDCFVATLNIFEQLKDKQRGGHKYGTKACEKKVVEELQNQYEIYEQTELDPDVISKGKVYEEAEKEAKTITNQYWSALANSHPKLYNKVQKAMQDYYDAKHKASQRLAKIHYDNMKEFEGKYIFITSHSDNDGRINSILEHGNTYRNVPCIKVSHH